MLEIIGVISGFICVYLASKEKIGTWLFGLINCVCLFILFYKARLYAEVILQIFFFVTNIYGWINWVKEQKAQKPIKNLSERHRWILCITMILLGTIMGLIIARLHIYIPTWFANPAEFAYFDSFIAIMSIIATILLVKRYVDSWQIWMLIDILCVYVYFSEGLYLLGVQYFVFMLIATQGYINFKYYDRRTQA